MKWENLNQSMSLSIEGLGIVLYSEGAVAEIEEGYDFLSNEYWQPQQVAAHILKGDVVGFCTGGGGDYELRFRSGYPDTAIEEKYPVALRLGIHVQGDAIRVIDLYWLMEWSDDCPQEQQLAIEPGFYHITLQAQEPLAARKESLSEEEYQIELDKPKAIYVFLNKLNQMPQLKYEGVPNLWP